MEFIREDCIYARQSVDRKDSISIESQIDFCKYELKGGSCRVFKDKGYSGKNTDRPEFQKLLGEIRKGKVRRVIVYKLDRISRSILDFATMMELFQEYDVEFVSSTEKFDTSTPMGRAMLNICIVFAQLERETIQKRVTDAYYSRCLKGFHMSGQAPYGYQLEPTVVEGIRTKKMVADPVAADHVRLMFEMYAEPETSFGDITRYFEEHDIKIYGKSMFRTFLSQLLRNPVYAQADLELYEFFKSQGAAIVNDASDFAGTNGCYLYQGRDVKEDKDRCLKDQILVIAPHEALISSDTWAHHGDLQAVVARGLRREFEPPLRIGGDGGDGRRIAQQGRRGEAHGGVVRCVDDLAAQQEFLLCGHVQRQERQQQEKRSFFHLSGVGTDALRCAGEVSCKVFCRLLSTNISILFRKSNTPPRSVRIIGKIAIFVV